MHFAHGYATQSSQVRLDSLREKPRESPERTAEN